MFKIEKLKSLRLLILKNHVHRKLFFCKRKKFDAMKRIQKKEFTGLVS
jgi:hypothetical protein